MARIKKKTIKDSFVEEVKTEPKKPVEEIKVELKEPAKQESKVVPVAEQMEVIGVIQAEKLQKAGWRLIDVSLRSDGKHYKFER